MTDPIPRPQLRKAVSARQFFMLAYGTVVGVGWLVYPGVWLSTSGPLGAIAGFAAGGVVMLVIALCYAEMAGMFPVSGGEVAYTYEVYGLRLSFLCGWLLAFEYIAVTSWEAISLALIADALFPGISGPELYSVGGHPVRLGSLLIALGGMVLMTALIYRGMKLAARFQEVLTAVFIVSCAVFIFAGIAFGETGNLEPFFHRDQMGSVWPGILAALMTAPFFMAGFDTIPQVMEEKSPGTSMRRAALMMVASIAAGGTFYCLLILSVSMATPWQDAVRLEGLTTAATYESRFDSPLFGRIIVFTGLLGLITTLNPIFIAASRLVFALGRARMIPAGFAAVHPAFGSPGRAVLLIGLIGALGSFLGRGGLSPIVGMAVMCLATVFFFVCLGVLILRVKRPESRRPFRVPGGVFTAGLGVAGSLFFLAVTVYEPYANSDGFPLEWTLFIGGLLLGLFFWVMAGKVRTGVSEKERRRLILDVDRSGDFPVADQGGFGGTESPLRAASSS
jgi:amino acid transporter